ncbi:MAG: L-histidine N(alpha)-methyltransferase, partial [Verrucomicrobiota bacterium]|nr:L-histidine N(alpha)-methyltransferase [Verrucomicrobiota bacterium]
MSSVSAAVRVLDLEPAASDFMSEAIAGLSASPRTLPSKFFYDARGAELFGQITELPEYYVTRTETAILAQSAAEMAESIGANAELVGLGTGAGVKTRMLLQQLENPIAYVPVDISKRRLVESATELSRVMPELEILPVCADYIQRFELPTPAQRPDHIAVYFPGSTIGNLEPALARSFLEQIARLCGREGGLIIGVDLQKPRDVLLAAYNDAQGVTAEFNLNLLVRANRELGADFVLPCWQHRAVYNEQEHRIEMHLISAADQTVRLGGREFRFLKGEKIVSEFSYK